LLTIRTFRYVALAEATSFLILLVCSFAARGGVPIMGPIHGMLFLAYVVIALSVRTEARWTNNETMGVLAGAVLPFGGFAVDRWIAKREQPAVA
jgi:integral membrane protein